MDLKIKTAKNNESAGAQDKNIQRELVYNDLSPQWRRYVDYKLLERDIQARKLGYAEREVDIALQKANEKQNRYGR